MPFIGKTPETGAFKLIDSITTSATDTYALTVNSAAYYPESARNLIVSLNGVTQAPESAYTVSGSNIVFASALTASDVIDYILVIGDAVDIGTPSDNTVGTDQLASTIDLSGKTLTFANDQISGNAIDGGTISNFASTGIDDNATSTAITIDSSQNVGIGTASPAGSLEIVRNTTSGGAVSYPNIRLDNQNAAGYQGIYFLQSGALKTGLEHKNDVGALQFFVGGASERMRIDSSGNVSIGATTSNNRKLSVTGSGDLMELRSTNAGAGGAQLDLIHNSASPADGDSVGLINFSNASAQLASVVGKSSSVSSNYGELHFGTRNGGTYNSSAMVLDRSGNLMVGKTNTLVSGQGLILKPLGDTYCSITNGYNTLHVYDITNSVYRFYVGGNGQVNYYSLNNLSDERDKQNIVDIPHGLSTVMSLKPRKFDWREEDQANGVYGFIAQEVETVLPSLVGEYKKDDNTTRKSLKQMELIPVLTKAIQEQQAMIEELKAEVAALKGAN